MSIFLHILSALLCVACLFFGIPLLAGSVMIIKYRFSSDPMNGKYRKNPIWLLIMILLFMCGLVASGIAAGVWTLSPATWGSA